MFQISSGKSSFPSIKHPPDDEIQQMSTVPSRIGALLSSPPHVSTGGPNFFVVHLYSHSRTSRRMAIALYPRTTHSMAIAVTREIFLGDYTPCKQVLGVSKFSYPPSLLASFLYQLTLCLSQNFFRQDDMNR